MRAPLPEDTYAYSGPNNNKKKKYSAGPDVCTLAARQFSVATCGFVLIFQ